MQITVSSEIANRMEDSSSIPARQAWEPDWMRRPWVLSDMDEKERRRRGGSREGNKKGGSICAMGPPVLGLLLAGGSVRPGLAGHKIDEHPVSQGRPAMESATALISLSFSLAATCVIWVLLAREPSRKVLSWATV